MSSRVAIVSDIHGNRTAFEAVLADLKETAPDLVLHGGDLADGGSAPAHIVDSIRALGWPGVGGNGEDMLSRPESLTPIADQAPHLRALFDAVREMASATRDALGAERLAWLGGLPTMLSRESLAVVHASPTTVWHAPGSLASDAELEAVYAPLGKAVAVYAHIHHPFVRVFPAMTVANTGSVSLSHDGDRRASYLLVEGALATIRRVEYDVDQETAALSSSGLPHAAWISSMLESASHRLP